MMDTQYLALLRGINVGGKNIIKMAELRTFLEGIGLEDVRTYIQSGNILFRSGDSPTHITSKLEESLSSRFSYSARVLVFSEDEYLLALKAAPDGWGQTQDFKHNALFTLPETSPEEILQRLPARKPEYESVTAGPRVLFWTASKEHLGKTSMMRLSRHALYKSLTVRNHKTVFKLRELMGPQPS
jgi:uncharacterized protein (DUF1697 family)